MTGSLTKMLLSAGLGAALSTSLPTFTADSMFNAPTYRYPKVVKVRIAKPHKKKARKAQGKARKISRGKR